MNEKHMIYTIGIEGAYDLKGQLNCINNLY